MAARKKVAKKASIKKAPARKRKAPDPIPNKWLKNGMVVRMDCPIGRTVSADHQALRIGAYLMIDLIKPITLADRESIDAQYEALEGEVFHLVEDQYARRVSG